MLITEKKFNLCQYHRRTDRQTYQNYSSEPHNTCRLNFQNKLPDNVPTLIQRKFIKKIKNKTRDEQQNKEKRKINK